MYVDCLGDVVSLFAFDCFLVIVIVLFVAWLLVGLLVGFAVSYNWGLWFCACCLR